MNVSTRKIVAAGAALLFGVVVNNAVMAEATAPAAAAAMKVNAMKHKGASSTEVKVIQEALNKEGAKLTVDGHMGKKTRDALMAFQSAHNLKATGHADKKTREALGLKS